MLLRKEDVEMRTEFDLSPLFRSTVGFDRMFDLLRHSTRGGVDEHHNYPPYDIERTGEDSYRVTLAVAGFRPAGLTGTAPPNPTRASGAHARRPRPPPGGGAPAGAPPRAGPADPAAGHRRQARRQRRRRAAAPGAVPRH